jgi:opacity protein-like surface antigen
MIRKPAVFSASRTVRSVFLIAILAGAVTALAQTPDQASPDQQNSAQQSSAQQPQSGQQPQSAQQPANSQSGNEEATPEEATPRHRVKPKEFKNWNYNVGGGANVNGGTTKQFVVGGGGTFGGGVARNANKYLGVRLDVGFDNLPLRQTALILAQASGGNAHVYTATLDPIINIPASKLWSGYLLFGPSYLHRSGKLLTSTALPGEACNAFFRWWARCFAGSLPLDVNFLHSSHNEFGYNVGGGVARKVYNNIEVYAEFRLIHGNHNNITTDVRPITMGVRW